MRYWVVILAFIGSLILTGCGTTGASSAQLARVAKDWCLTIRASQVIPAYPLTEDLQPGDVFLVRTPLEEQINLFDSKGFLPLENLVTRQPLTGYAAFYENSFGTAGHTNTPHHWQFPDDPTVTNGWAVAPRAGFPSYTFSVERGAGMSLALPVQGVPVALSLLGAGKAHGSIELSDAYTYGLDMQSVQRQIEVWARKGANKDFLSQFEPENGKTNYLRVVDRVYLVKTVNVSVTSDEAYGATVSGGAPKPVNLLDPVSGDGSNHLARGSNYLAVVSALAAQMDTALPGGTLKLAAASGRSVSMVETFPRPLVVGYIAFDLPICQGGDLGAPARTYARLTRAKVPDAKARVLEKYALVRQIITYCKAEGQDTVDGAKLKALAKGSGLPSDWADRFDKKDIAILREDLQSDDYEYVPALSKNLPVP